MVVQMNQKRRTEITVETHKVTIIRQSATALARGWCHACAAEVELANFDQAATLSGLGTRALYQQIELDQLHFQELADGRLFICLNSLLKEKEL